MSLTSVAVPLFEDEQVPQILPDDSPRVRKPDPITSHEAADSTFGKVAASREEVWHLLFIHGLLADHELVAAHSTSMARFGSEPLYSPSRLRSARAELVEAGKVEFSGIYRLTPSGRRTQVWQVVS